MLHKSRDLKDTFEKWREETVKERRQGSRRFFKLARRRAITSYEVHNYNCFARERGSATERNCLVGRKTR